MEIIKTRAEINEIEKVKQLEKSNNNKVSSLKNLKDQQTFD